MKNKSAIKISFFIAFLLLALSCAQTATAANQTITNTTPGGIENAINLVNPGETVFLTSGTYTGNTNTNITINKSVTIQGNGPTSQVTIDAEKMNRIFTIANNVNVTFINVTFVNGYVLNEYGGAIYNHNINSRMTIINCAFTNNLAKYGGAIYNNLGPDFKLIGSNFTNNSAIHGGAIWIEGNFSLITNCSFSNNSAINVINDSGFGGAIHIQNSYLSIIANSTFTNQYVTNGGAAIYLRDLLNSTIFNCTFTNNIVNYTNPSDLGKGGGAILSDGDINSGSVLVDRCTFTNNSAIQARGGAIVVHRGAGFTITNSNFINNYAVYGGAIEFFAGANFSVANCNFTNNSAMFRGGAIFNGGDFTTVSNCIFTNNKITELDASIQRLSGAAIYNTADNTGDGVTRGLNFTVINSTFINNTVGNGTGGAISNFNSANFNVINSNFTNNSAIDGGAIHNTGLSFTVTSSNFTNNFATTAGGAINIWNGTSSITNCNFASNNAQTGGAIYHGSNYLTVTTSNFTANSEVIRINGSFANVTGNNMINNLAGIIIESGATNNQINYNRIFNNTQNNGFNLINNGINTNADFNWWGNNNPLVSGLSLANWFVMELSANGFTTTQNASTNLSEGIVELSYDFLLINGATGVTSSVPFGLLPDFLVNIFWKDTNGATYNLTNVDAKVKYSQNFTVTSDNGISIQAIGDNSNIMLILGVMTNNTNTTNNTTNNTTTPTNNNTNTTEPIIPLIPEPIIPPNEEKPPVIPGIPENPKGPADNDHPRASAISMKNTGVPINIIGLITLCLFSLVGIFFKRRISL